MEQIPMPEELRLSSYKNISHDGIHSIVINCAIIVIANLQLGADLEKW